MIDGWLMDGSLMANQWKINMEEGQEGSFNYRYIFHNLLVVPLAINHLAIQGEDSKDRETIDSLFINGKEPNLNPMNI